MVQVMTNVDDMQVAQGTPPERAERATEVRQSHNAAGKLVELHLTEENAKRYDEAHTEAFDLLGPWLDAGTEVVVTGRGRANPAPRSGQSGRSGRSSSSAEREENRRMREELQQMGATLLSNRGRPPGELIEAWKNGDRDAVKRWNDDKAAKQQRAAEREASGQ